MGAYVYALRSPKLMKTVRIKDRITGEIHTAKVGSMSYLYKPHFYQSRDRDTWVNPVFTRLENLWKGVERPTLAVFTEANEGHKIKVGQAVGAFLGNSPFVPFAYNDASESFVVVGDIVEILKDGAG